MKLQIELSATNADGQADGGSPAVVTLSAHDNEPAHVYLEIDDSGAVKLSVAELAMAIRRLQPGVNFGSVFDSFFGNHMGTGMGQPTPRPTTHAQR
jgi:hypothetical protein